MAFFGSGSILRRFDTKEIDGVRGAGHGAAAVSGPMFLVGGARALAACRCRESSAASSRSSAADSRRPAYVWVALLLVLVNVAFFGVVWHAGRMVLTPAPTRRAARRDELVDGRRDGGLLGRRRRSRPPRPYGPRLASRPRRRPARGTVSSEADTPNGGRHHRVFLEGRFRARRRGGAAGRASGCACRSPSSTGQQRCCSSGARASSGLFVAEQPERSLLAVVRFARRARRPARAARPRLAAYPSLSTCCPACSFPSGSSMTSRV